ncbi:MAG: hypothetical protein DME88_04570 [Verrucomicrobia bacterium]|nr:MAG: hypothetical protein DME88_04570 [Verrucomicrobiota bacterium]
MEIRAIGIDRDKIPDFVWSRGEKNLLPVDCPTRVMRRESHRRDRRENSIGDLFLACAVKIRDVNSVIAFESNALIDRKCSHAKTG